LSNLAIDIGNTRIKVAIFENDELISLVFFDADDMTGAERYISTLSVSQCILSTTQQDNQGFLDVLRQHVPTINFTSNTPLPINIGYGTPNTLGDDRKAAICGAVKLAGKRKILVITAGTCITYNYFNGKAFTGGGISPGLVMRYKAMNRFTGNLPLVENQEYDELVGTTTEKSMLSGVRKGITAEMDGLIQQYLLLDQDLQVFVCGGDTNFFETRLKSKIFARPNLVLHGLNFILQHNLK